MKIIFITDSYIPGMGRFMNIAPEKLKKRGHDVVLYTSSVQDEPFTMGTKPPKYVKKIKGKILFNKIFYPGLIKKLLFEEKPDVVHSYVAGFFGTFVAGYLKKIKGYPLVVDADISIHQPYPRKLKKIYFLLYKKLPTSFADVILAFTEEQKKRMVKKFGFKEEKIVVMPWGVNTKRFLGRPKKNFRKKYGLEGKFILLNVAQIIQIRNFEMMIKAISMIDDRDVVVVNIGSPTDVEYKKRLDSLIRKLGVEDRFIFLGQMSFDDVIDFYKTADVYLQTALSEGFCVPLIEAPAAGLPTISTNVGVARDIIKESKIGFIVKNEKEVADKIKLLKKNKKLRIKMGKNGREVAKEFDWERIIDGLEKIYNDLINK